MKAGFIGRYLSSGNAADEIKMYLNRPIDWRRASGVPGRRRGRPACCYETRETDGKRKEQSERDEGDGVRKVGTEGGQGRRSDNAAVLTHRFTRAVGPPFCPALIGAPLKILLRFHKNQTAAS